MGPDTDALIGTIKKNASEQVRITLGRYRNLPRIDVRIWYRTEHGDYQPTRRGLSLPLERLAELIQALERARHAALDRGLLKPGPETLSLRARFRQKADPARPSQGSADSKGVPGPEPS